MKTYAVNTLKRSPQAPDIPTIAEVTGIKDYDYPPDIGIVAPAKTPPRIIARLADAIAKGVHHNEAAQRYTTLGIEPIGNTPEQFAAQIRIDIAKYAKVVKTSGLKID